MDKKGVVIRRIRNISIEIILIWLAICIALVGSVITITGTFLNGWAIFNDSRDLSKGFGLILMGNSIILVGVALIALVFMLSIFRWYCEKTRKTS